MVWIPPTVPLSVSGAAVVSVRSTLTWFAPCVVVVIRVVRGSTSSWMCSSVWSERCLHTAMVGGSNPSTSTNGDEAQRQCSAMAWRRSRVRIPSSPPTTPGHRMSAISHPRSVRRGHLRQKEASVGIRRGCLVASSMAYGPSGWGYRSDKSVVLSSILRCATMVRSSTASCWWCMVRSSPAVV